MSEERICLEYGHTYLDRLREDTSAPDLEYVQQFIDKFGGELVKVVIVDDTNVEMHEDFEQERYELSLEYVENLPIRPDALLWESDFTAAVRDFMGQVPEVSKNELNRTDCGQFYSSTDEGTYLYHADDGGPRRARVTDERDGAKRTGFTCGAYDAAMTLAKLGEIPAPESQIQADHALTFHDPNYLGSPPFDVSAAIREFLVEGGIVNEHSDRVHNVPVDEPAMLSQMANHESISR